MPIIPIISAASGAIIGWWANDTAEEAVEPVKDTVNYASIAIAAVIAFVVLKKIKVF